MEIKINDLVEEDDIKKKSHSTESYKYRIRAKNKKYVILYFIYFFEIISLICFFLSSYCLDQNINGKRLIIVTIIFFFSSLIVFARIANCYFEIEQAKLLIIEEYLKRYKNFINDNSGRQGYSASGYGGAKKIPKLVSQMV